MPVEFWKWKVHTRDSSIFTAKVASGYIYSRLSLPFPLGKPYWQKKTNKK